MALDHSRDFFGFTNFDPTDPTSTTPALFFTRWITHSCAPVFVFLAGTGAALGVLRGKPRREAARTLVLRGIWLIFLEFTVIRVGWFFGFALDCTYRFAFVQVIWALGWSMIALAGLMFLPRRLMFAVSLAIACGHNALDHVEPESLGPLSGLWTLLHVSGPIHWGKDDAHVLFVRYPLIPWPAVMALGYLFAPILTLPRDSMRRVCALLGAAMVAAFLVVRIPNLYGDPAPWSRQDSPLGTALSFLNVTKYPASLSYLLITLGPAIASLAILDRLPGMIRRVIDTFGKVPMFFYITHLYLLQLGGAAFAYARYGGEILQWEFGPPSDYYIGLAPVYLGWAGAILILYFPCRWYARVKHGRPAWWHWMM